MDIYIYSDESGVFDKQHNDFFVFAGIIFLGKEEKDIWTRKYSHKEKQLRAAKKVSCELKANFLSNKEKSGLFRSLNNCFKFCAIIREKQVLDRIFESKKSKQRYLDYVFKIAVKRALTHLIDENILDPDSVSNIHFFVDEHTTATDGRYELREALEQEFKIGTFNYNFHQFYDPVFPKMGAVYLKWCDSKTTLLVRAADIIANKVYYLRESGQFTEIPKLPNMKVTYFPSHK